MSKVSQVFPFCVAVLMGSASVHAQPAQPTQSAPAAADTTSAAPKDAVGGPSSLVILFDEGKSTLRAQDKATLDRASRAYNEGKPIVMIVTGSSDRVGNPRMNLSLSQNGCLGRLAGPRHPGRTLPGARQRRNGTADPDEAGHRGGA